MSVCPDFSHLLILPNLRVQNANAVSSPQTHGFPAMTAWLGWMWALERKARRSGIGLAFNAVGVVSHGYQELLSEGGFIQSLSLTRNPLDKDGGTAAIVQEGRIHLDLTLVLAVSGENWSGPTQQADIATIADLVNGMHLAGGTLLPEERPWLRRFQPWVIDQSGTDDDQIAEFRSKRMRLLPGVALVSRDDLIDKRVAELQASQPTATRLDAWLSLSRINWYHLPDPNGGTGKWVHDRVGRGWIVPIPVGYGALTELQSAGTVANARDKTTPFRFVESLYSMGEWVGPHRLRSPRDFLWYADSRLEEGLYRCRNDYCADIAPDSRRTNI